jgi:hypothetical protein
MLGIFWKSQKMIQPGAAEAKDKFWGGDDTMKQALEHLEEVREMNKLYVANDVYDNSNCHNCMAKDALLVDKLNKGAGHCRKHALNIRDGYYMKDDERVAQSMFFCCDDILNIDINKDAKLAKVLLLASYYTNYYYHYYYYYCYYCYYCYYYCLHLIILSTRV